MVLSTPDHEKKVYSQFFQNLSNLWNQFFHYPRPLPVELSAYHTPCPFDQSSIWPMGLNLRKHWFYRSLNRFIRHVYSSSGRRNLTKSEMFNVFYIIYMLFYIFHNLTSILDLDLYERHVFINLAVIWHIPTSGHADAGESKALECLLNEPLFVVSQSICSSQRANLGCELQCPSDW